MLRLRNVPALLLAASSVPACSKPLSPDECGRLLDRYVELLARANGDAPNAQELAELERRARAKASRDPAFARCPAEVSRSEFECAMQAPDADELERCLIL